RQLRGRRGLRRCGRQRQGLVELPDRPRRDCDAHRGRASGQDTDSQRRRATHLSARNFTRWHAFLRRAIPWARLLPGGKSDSIMQLPMNGGDGAADANPSQTLAIGEVVADKYRIERLLGSGGMAEVYGAVNIRTERRVALKWILPALAASNEVLARFRREAPAAGRINHPHVLTIFDVLEHHGSARLV